MLFETKATVSEHLFFRLEEILFEEEDLTGWNLQESRETGMHWVQGVFTDAEQRDVAEARLNTLVGEPLGYERAELRDTDWLRNHREHFQPWSFGEIHWVPSWLKDEYELPTGHEVVWLDPGMAFGTGNHATTRLCLEQIIQFKQARSDWKQASVLDAGCGSGILSISAAKLGFLEVAGFDIDEDSVRIARENTMANQISTVAYSIGGLTTELRRERTDLLLANILATTLLESIGALAAALAPCGSLVLSGILATEATMVRERFSSDPRLEHQSLTTLDEWACLRFIRNSESR